MTSRAINAFFFCNADAIHTGESGLSREWFELVLSDLRCRSSKILTGALTARLVRSFPNCLPSGCFLVAFIQTIH